MSICNIKTPEKGTDKMSFCHIKTPVINNEKDANDLERLLKEIEECNDEDSNE